ncbi:MAG TPA: phage tail sheath C-terminal domain-containing protein [Pyrinomonadaceae bacterium]|jgi:hypothetical protein|nr:phage tail sheath C-terminal domain-containing protein [Pyrinomonadaceae bacterium]
MPEYLAPGVYVEEIDTGSKPIEGVSTSTTGVVGITERGPTNVPILVTSYGEFTRWFGERLDINIYRNGTQPHCYLPHAAEGFFTNGGKRLYVTRVLGVGASNAAFDLGDRGAADSASTLLLRVAGEGTGTLAATPLYALSIDSPVAGALANNSLVRVGDGSDAEYRQVQTVEVAANTTHVPLNFPISRAHAAAATVHNIHRALLPFPSAANTLDLHADASAGATEVVLHGAAGDVSDLSANQLIEIGGQFSSEHRFVTTATVDPADNTLVTATLDAPLALAHAAAANAVTRLDVDITHLATVPIDNNTLDAAANAGDRVAYVVNRNNNFDDRTTLVVFEIANNSAREARRIGDLYMLTLSTGAYDTYSASTVVERVDLGDDGGVTVKHLTANAAAGTTVIALDNRVGLAAGGVLRVGVAPDDEYVSIASVPNPSPGGAAPNAGNVVLAYPLGRAHASGAQARLQNAPAVNAARPATSVLLDVAGGGTNVSVTDGTGYAQNEFVRFTADSGLVTYHRLDANATQQVARLVGLTVPLSRAHAAGATLVERGPLLNVQALDAGIWGNRLRVSVEDESGLVSRTSVGTVVDANHIRLASAAGVEAGTVLEVFDPATGTAVGDPLKVTSINRASNYTITLAGAGISVAQQAAGLAVRSREFRMTVLLLRQPDPALPSRNENVIASEVFRNLSMDPRHSRYVANVVGDVNGPPRLSDHRPEGESWYVRVEDAAVTQVVLESVRLGPETLLDTLPNGRTRPARHPLSGGDDAMGSVGDATYMGVDDIDPEKRTGLYSLRNVEEISLVACPGQTGLSIQDALIDHCELMRYRFAVLDGQPPPDDSLADVQTQRQQFDTKYAALYHPWLLIPDPFPVNLSSVTNFPVPPSGHMLGIYARTDIERGVHKAPANEVVRGITGLQRTLSKGEQEILNPYPVNINVIRDFRNNNRGIRVYGGRVITSDSDWKYVNVRRLLIFIEDSVDRGLQWVVFEPNAEPLWARVVRTVSDFLTVVWRNGALEGTKVEEAFFVKCDRTTMTQTDIDSGRLICVVGVAPVKPAEFVIIRIGLFTANADV